MHAEMTFDKVIGGWLTVLTDAEITTISKAESMLHGSHVTRTRWCHQVSVLALTVLREEADAESCLQPEQTGRKMQGFSEWRNNKMATCPQFDKWRC